MAATGGTAAGPAHRRRARRRHAPRRDMARVGRAVHQALEVRIRAGTAGGRLVRIAIATAGLLPNGRPAGLPVPAPRLPRCPRMRWPAMSRSGPSASSSNSGKPASTSPPGRRKIPGRPSAKARPRLRTNLGNSPIPPTIPGPAGDAVEPGVRFARTTNDVLYCQSVTVLSTDGGQSSRASGPHRTRSPTRFPTIHRALRSTWPDAGRMDACLAAPDRGRETRSENGITMTTYVGRIRRDDYNALGGPLVTQRTDRRRWRSHGHSLIRINA